MKLSIYQMDVAYKQKETNLNRLEKALKGHRTDVLVLPEFFTTGMLFTERGDIFDLSETIPGGPTCRRLAAVAKASDCYVVGSIPEREGDRLYNTAVVFSPKGFVGRQRKRHITDYEKPFFDAGDDLNLFSIGGYRAGVLVCYDCEFPELVRCYYRQGAALLLHTANVLSPTTYDIMKVRALECRAVSVVANRVGREAAGTMAFNYLGGSRIIGHDGAVICAAGEGETMIAAEVDLAPAADKTNGDCADIWAEVGKYKGFYARL